MTAARRRRRDRNAMTIDVEDYFHVSNFEHLVARDSWAGRESRVEANTDRLLAIFDRAGVRATFFVLAWVAERVPGLVRRIAARRARGGLARLRASADLRPDAARRSATTCGARSDLLEDVSRASAWTAIARRASR